MHKFKQGKNRNVERLQSKFKLKKNVEPSYYEWWKLPFHILALVVTKLQKMVEQGLLEYILPGNQWASSVVILWKPDGDLGICE